jgi:hypothetical protein
MRRIKARLAIACICAVATALFAGVALAGNGKDNAPGQVKQDGTAAQPAAEVEAQADASVAAAASDHVAPGQAKQDATSSSSTQSNSSQASSNASSNTTSNGAVQQNGNASPAVAGMKPDSSTTSTKWTTCDPTGGTSSAATCPSTNGTAQAHVHNDASKRYGNAETAAQIAVSRGGSGVKLTGPGNSQPHKVAVCPHKSNQSGGVDVHAIKSGGYSSAACTATQTQQVLTSSVCGSKSVTTVTTTSQAALHGNGKQLGKGTAKHQVTSSSSSTVVTPTGEVCTTGKPGEVVQSSQSNVTPVTVVTPATTAATTAGSTAAPANTGSVAGAQAALAAPKTQHAAKATKAQQGVLGTVAKVSGSTLPFTGFPLWMALVVALGLIGTGLTLRRRGSTLGVQ